MKPPRDAYVYEKFDGKAIYIAQINTENYQKLEQKIAVLEQHINTLESQYSSTNSLTKKP